MIKSKLCQLLQTLTEEEWRGFERFVASPYFNSYEKCKQLLAYLKEQFLEDEWASLDKKAVEAHLFEGTTYNDAYLRIVISNLTKILEDFFVQRKLEDRPFYKAHFLRNSLIERGLFKYFEQERKQLIRSNEKLEQQNKLKRGLDYYLSQYLLATDYSRYLQLKNARNIPLESVTDNIRCLDDFFLINRLHLLNSHLSIQENLQIKTTLPFLEEVMSMVHATAFQDNVLIQSYFASFQLLLHPDEEEWFDKVQQQIEHQSTLIPQQELNELYTIVINHYIRKSNSVKNYYVEVLALYKLMAQYGFLSPEQYITPGKFKNIVTLGCFFKEFEWTKNFMETYQLKLAPKNRDSIFNFNMGAFYFYQQQFEIAQAYLAEVAPFDIYYTLDVRSLLLRIYYERGQYFAVTQAVPSLKDFIRKQKRFPRTVKQSYTRFISILIKLTKLKQKYIDTEKQKTQLLTKINSYPSILHKEWLWEKIQVL